jgi:hypothetical protein
MTLLVAYKTVHIVIYANQPKEHVESWVHNMVISCSICVSRKFICVS